MRTCDWPRANSERPAQDAWWHETEMLFDGLDDGEFTEVAYFTSEIEARLGESRRPDEEMAELMQRWDDVLEVDRYLDLTEPWLVAR